MTRRRRSPLWGLGVLTILLSWAPAQTEPVISGTFVQLNNQLAALGSEGWRQELAFMHDIGIDTLIVGEGPHHTTVEAQEHDLLIIYAGHYATERAGIRRLGELVSAEFGVEAEFIEVPNPI